jgi:hypothetical protein
MPDDEAVTTHRPTEGYEPGEPRRVGHTVHRPDNAADDPSRSSVSPESRPVGEHRRSNREGEVG